MKKVFPVLACLLISFIASGQSKLLSPKEFLGYELGERFTYHHRVVDYYKHVADVLPQVDLVTYGESYEHRPLVFAVITAPENFANLEQIRTDNLKRAGLIDGSPSADKKAIVWLSYNVHGNEASGTEAAMLTLYELANTQNSKTQAWLKNTVVILDPCLNPDGRDRYANFYNQYGNFPANASPDARENLEPWPRGRSNHYLFDLNRDWAWSTQQETQQRIKVYNQWMPHVHVDFHEQGHNSPYYFAPAAEPFHEVVSSWQREFQTMIGKNNAKYFDEQGWLYFTKEIFDLYYPSYGDTYPCYNGAIGMTYEQGGQRGLSILTKEGDVLTLKERLTHHHTTGLSTVEITALNYTRVVDEFEKYFRENLNSPSATYKTYVIKGTNHRDKIQQMTRWMDSHSIRYGHPAASKTTRGFDYQTQSTGNVTLNTDDIIVNVYQPKSRFITTVFEPLSKLSDSLTYDVTAWNLMYAHNLKAYALNERINIGKAYTPAANEIPAVTTPPYAYVFEYQSMKDVSLLTTLMQKGVKVRTSLTPFSISGKKFDRGSLVVTRRNNEKVKDFDQVVQTVSKSLDRKFFAAATGFLDEGKDFGSTYVNYLKPPKAAVLMGEHISSLAVGEIWHFFEQQAHYPVTLVPSDYFRRIDLSKFDVLILPEGDYATLLDDKMNEALATWVSNGGRLIVMTQALSSFADKKGFALKSFTSDEDKEKFEKNEKALAQKDALTRYEDAQRKDISATISGAIYKINIDNSHPLGFGLPATYYTLKTNELHFAYLGKRWNVGRINGKAKPVQGFAGSLANRQLENTLVFGVEEKGKGNIIYMADNPLFRCFWEDGKMIFANAVFVVGQ